MDKPSLDGLTRFLAWLGDKGLLNSSTSSALKSSCTRVYGIIDPAPGDVFAVNLEATLRRFANLNPEVSPESLRTYQSRIAKAIALYDRYLKDPVGFRVDEPADVDSGQSGQARVRAASRSSKTVKPVRDRADDSVSVPAVAAVDSLNYPFPLRPEHTVMLANLPRDLKSAEAERIAAFLRSLAVDFTP